MYLRSEPLNRRRGCGDTSTSRPKISTGAKPTSKIAHNNRRSADDDEDTDAYRRHRGLEDRRAVLAAHEEAGRWRRRVAIMPVVDVEEADTHTQGKGREEHM